MSDFSNASVILLVFAMPGCPACEEYLPRLNKAIAAYQKTGFPLVYYAPGHSVQRGTIPVLVVDATSNDQSIQQYADENGINAMPCTLLFMRGRPTQRHEGALEDAEIHQLLRDATTASR